MMRGALRRILSALFRTEGRIVIGLLSLLAITWAVIVGSSVLTVFSLWALLIAAIFASSFGTDKGSAPASLPDEGPTRDA